jgi:hypothetical protein
MGNHPSTILIRRLYEHILPFMDMGAAFSARRHVFGLIGNIVIVREVVLNPADLDQMKHNPFPGSCYWYVFVTRGEEAQRWDLMDRVGCSQAIFNYLLKG